MLHEQELRFICDTFRKCQIQTTILDSSTLSDHRLSSALQALFPGDKNRRHAAIEDATVYRTNDSLSCCYIFFRLSDLSPDALMLIGPYLTANPSSQQIMEWAEAHSISPNKQKQLAEQYADMPLVIENSHLFLMLDTFFEHLWGINGYKFIDLNWELFAQSSPLSHENALSDEPVDSLWNIRMVEKRYGFENELMDAVANGQQQKAEILVSSLSAMPFERRLADPIRELKNHGVITNTILRKAAERGGVPPVYLDRVSSDFARQIEQQTTSDALTSLMGTMLHSYCRLVRKHSMKQYTPLVQKTITCIDAELSTSLSLQSLAKRLNVSGSYLSTVFKKETGQTITGYINSKRIRHAMHLLSSTNLQVQTISQHCGILDIHYFTKLFKKTTGLTPKEYRESLKNQHIPGG